jgi:hypothetical protein
MNANKIKMALAYVHHHEAQGRGAERVTVSEAAAQAVKICGLTADEQKILLTTLHLELRAGVQS